MMTPLLISLLSYFFLLLMFLFHFHRDVTLMYIPFANGL